jgi:uncharacterized membrane protein
METPRIFFGDELRAEEARVKLPRLQREGFKPGTSSLFTPVRRTDPEPVIEAFLGFGGKVLVSSAGRESEAVIQGLLDRTSEGIQ